jgi:hypothetical protein
LPAGVVLVALRKQAPALVTVPSNVQKWQGSIELHFSQQVDQLLATK